MKKSENCSLKENNQNINDNIYYREKLLINCGFPSNFFELIANFFPKIETNKKDNYEINSLKKSIRLEENIVSSAIVDKGKNDCSIKEKIEREKILLGSNTLKLNKKKLINNPRNKRTIKNDKISLNKEESDLAIKSYKSKYKNKYQDIYENNSIIFKNKNKYKLYHKCSYPGCNRTYTYSGWLKAHYKVHLKEIHESAYCKLFEKYKLEQNLNEMQKKLNKSFNNNYNNLNTFYNNFSFVNPHINMFNYFNMFNRNINSNSSIIKNYFYNENNYYKFNNMNNSYFPSILAPQNDKIYTKGDDHS